MKMFPSSGPAFRPRFQSAVGMAALLVCLSAATAALAQTATSPILQPTAQTTHATSEPRIAIVPISKGLQESDPSLDISSSDPILQGSPIGQAALNSGGIEYHNAPNLAIAPHIYFIWYGNWNGNTATSILPQFISDLNHTMYFNTNTTYGTEWTDGNGSGQILSESTVVNAISFNGQAFDSYSQGTTLSFPAVEAVVSRALASGLPTDGNGVYLVLTSADVTATTSDGSFCNNFCGYHSAYSHNGFLLPFGFIGNPDRCNICAPSVGQGPNGNSGADGMANVLAHEINEIVTNPHLNDGWYHINGKGEVGDLCSFKFGNNIGTAPNGAPFNVTFNGRHYLIQQNWLNIGNGSCSLGYATPNGTPAAGKVAVIGTPGCDPGGACDTGTIQMQITTPSAGNVTETIMYDGAGFQGPGDTQGIANALANAFNTDPNNNFVSASVQLGNPYWAPTGNTVYWIIFTTKQNGASMNTNSWNITINSFFPQITGGTLSLTPSTGSMTGGAAPCCPN